MENFLQASKNSQNGASADSSRTMMASSREVLLRAHFDEELDVILSHLIMSFLDFCNANIIRKFEGFFSSFWTGYRWASSGLFSSKNI